MSMPGYFTLRRMDSTVYRQRTIPPAWLEDVLPGPGGRVLEVGCGMGGVLCFLRDKGYRNLLGVDVDRDAVNCCLEAGLKVNLISSIEEFAATSGECFDLVLMFHVLEHLEKKDIIPTLAAIRSIMSHGGRIVVSVPNAQSPTGSYWAYEDFTHSTIFTSGSLYHVLKGAGFNQVNFVDPFGLAGLSPFKKILRRSLITLYDWNRTLINRLTGSSWHEPSPRIYTFEIKAIAFNP